MFFATHRVDSVDARVLRRLGSEAREVPAAQPWLALFRNSERAAAAGAAEHAAWAAPGLEVFVWTRERLFEHYPRLAAAVAASPGFAATVPAKQRYYWYFHASLGLWNATYGHAYPRVRWWWRLETDVLCTASLASLVAAAAARSARADLLLPKLVREMDNPRYSHWAWNAHLLRGAPAAQHVYSLVPVGRFSTAFLRMMARDKWERGVVGYEEIAMPLACARAAGCTVAAMGGALAAAVRYRPAWNCSQFMAARRRASPRRPQLFHPVKQRACFAEALEGG